MAITYQAVATYGDQEFPELHRCAGVFLDGVMQRKVMYYNGAFHVKDVYGIDVAVIPWRPAPDSQGHEDIAVRSIGCIRSSQSGNLVLTPGYFYAGGGGQRAATVATNYPVAEPLTWEEYKAGKR